MTTSTTVSPDVPAPVPERPVASLREVFVDLLRDGPKELRQFFQTERHWLFVLVPLAVLSWRAGRLSWPLWFGVDSVLGFQALVPFFAAFLVWARRHELAAQYAELASLFPADSPKRRGNPLLVLAGCLLFLLSCFSLYPPIAVFSLLLAVIGVVYYIYGPFLLRTLWQPLVFLFLAVPPAGLIVQQQVIRIKTIAVIAVSALRFAYPDVQGQGATLVIHGFPLTISAVSSGALAAFSIGAFALFVAFLRRLPLLNGLAYVVVASFVALVINLGGLILTALVGAGNNAAGAVLLSFLPFLLLVVSLVVAWRMAHFFRLRRRRAVTLAPAPGVPLSGSINAEETDTAVNLDEMSEVDRIEALYRAEQTDSASRKEQE